MTAASHKSGTERVHEISNSLAADVYVNVQGDEPLVRSEQIATLLDVMKANVAVGTVKTACQPEDLRNPNAVKVVTADDGRALYFSRATIPCDRDKTGFTDYRKHLGIYAYRKAALERFASLPPSPLEKLERLEQLRLLESGIAIYVADAPRDTIGVDTEEDLVRAEALLTRVHEKP